MNVKILDVTHSAASEEQTLFGSTFSISAARLASAQLFCSLTSCFVDASAAMQVRALKDYCNNYDLTSLNIKAGDIITVQRCNSRSGVCLCTEIHQSSVNWQCSEL